MTPQPPFYDGQPDAIRAVIEMAELRTEITEEAWERLLAAFCPANAESIREIADDLAAIGRFADKRDADALAAHFGPEYRALDPVRTADETCASLQRDVVLRASLVASLLRVAA